MQRTAALALLALALSALALSATGGCTRDEPPPASPTVDDSDLDRLRALAYVDTPDVGDRPSGVVLHDRERAQPGLNYTTSAQTCSSRLVDMDGERIREWRHRPCFRWDNSVLREDGSIVVVHRDPGAAAGVPEGRSLLVLDWNGDVLWQHELPTHHDVAVVGPEEALTLTFSASPRAEIHPEIPVRDDQIVRVTAGHVETLLSLAELSDALELPLGVVRPSKLSGEPMIDLFHANSVQVLGPNRVLVTCRHQDLLLDLELDPVRVRWLYGPGELSGPHDGTRLESGNVLVFDNGLDRERSRVVEVDPRTNTVVWQHDGGEEHPFYTRSRGAAQRLANGNTLVTVSDEAFAFEVTPEGDRVWEYHNPERTADGRGVALVRMRRVQAASENLTGPPFLPSD